MRYWLLALTACGRIGFEAVPGGGQGDGGNVGDGRRTGDGGPTGDSGASTGQVTWVKTVVAHTKAMNAVSDTFTVQATNAGDAIVLHVFCLDATHTPSVASVSAPSWLFAVTGVTSGGSGYYASSALAIAPDTNPATVTVSWLNSNNCSFMDEIGDELTGNDPVLGNALDIGMGSAGTGDCTMTLVTPHANDTIWAGCTSMAVTAVGAGYTKGADDGNGDWTEYAVRSDPASTAETPTFSSTGAVYVMTAIAVRPR